MLVTTPTLLTRNYLIIQAGESNIAENFSTKNLGDIGKFGDMSTFGNIGTFGDIGTGSILARNRKIA